MTKPAALVHLHPPALSNLRRFFTFAKSRLVMGYFILLVMALLASTHLATAQGRYTIYGDLKVDESKVEGPLPSSFHVILYSPAGTVVGRQTVPPGGAIASSVSGVAITTLSLR